MSLALFSLANYVAHAPDDPGFYLFAATLTLALYLGVGLGAATFFTRQRPIAALGRQLAARVAELDTLYAVAHTLATEEALLPPLQRVLQAVRELAAMPLAGIVPLGDPILATLAPRDLRDLRAADDGAAAPLSLALARHVAERREPLLVADTTVGAVSGALVPAPWHALVALPIVVGDTSGASSTPPRARRTPSMRRCSARWKRLRGCWAMRSGGIICAHSNSISPSAASGTASRGSSTIPWRNRCW